MKNTKKLIEDFYKYYKLIKTAKDNHELRKKIEESRYFDAVEEISDIINNDAKEGWDMILQLVKNSPTDYILVCIGAGILENFLVKFGEKYIDKVSNESSRNPKLHFALSSVWQNKMSEYVWTKVREAVELGLKSDKDE